MVALGKHPQPLVLEGTSGERITEGWMLGQVLDHRLNLRCAWPTGLFGVMFQPTGFYQLFGMSMAAAASRGPGEECGPRRCGQALLGRVQAAETHAQRVAAAEALLLAEPRHSTPGTAAVEAVGAALRQRRSQVHTQELAQLAHLSRRQLERRFREAVGVSPKRFAEISRFARVFQHLKEQPNANWHDLAQSCGYFDQAHFIREFRRFAGETPAAFFHHGRNADPLAWSG
jgi:AraC-like DNA-binding protein